MRKAALGIAIAVLATATAPVVAREARRCGGYRVTKAGTSADDVIRGTKKVDVIAGLGGDDRITGRGNGDVLCGGDGNDVLKGNGRADTLIGGPGDDELFAGRKKVRQGRCDDTGGGPGAAPSACVFLWDVLLGESGADVLVGSPSPDSLSAGPGHDRVRGDAGSDSIDADGGDDVVRAGPGDDSLSYTGAPRRVRVRLDEGRATGWGKDVLEGVENVAGSVYSDVLVGDEHDNDLTAADEGAGDRGDDVIRGRRGDDYMFGYSGADEMHGGAGDDFINGDYTKNKPGPDRLFGGRGRDKCFYGERYAGCEKR